MSPACYNVLGGQPGEDDKTIVTKRQVMMLGSSMLVVSKLEAVEESPQLEIDFVSDVILEFEGVRKPRSCLSSPWM